MLCLDHSYATHPCNVSIPIENLSEWRFEKDMLTLKSQLIQNYVSSTIVYVENNYHPLYFGNAHDMTHAPEKLLNLTVGKNASLDQFVIPLILGGDVNNTGRRGGLTYFRIAKSNKVKSQTTKDSYTMISTNAFVFISCQALNDGVISFKAFYTPYQLKAWISIFITFVVTSLFWSLIFVVSSRPYAYAQYFIIPLILIEQVPQISVHLTKRPCINMTILMWLLTGVILTNAYKGIVTVDMCAPMPKLYATTAEELIQYNFTLYMDLTPIGKYHRLEHLERNFKHTAENVTSPSSSETVFGFATTFSNETFDKKGLLYDKLLEMTRFPLSKHTVDNVELEIFDCNKTAYLAEESTIESKFYHMERSIKTGNSFQKGCQRFMITHDLWQMSSRVAKEYLRGRLEHLLGSGIFHWWLGRIKSGRTLPKRKTYARKFDDLFYPVAQAMQTNILAVFIVLGIGLVTALLNFYLELVIKNISKIINLGNRILEKFLFGFNVLRKTVSKIRSDII